MSRVRHSYFWIVARRREAEKAYAFEPRHPAPLPYPDLLPDYIRLDAVLFDDWDYYRSSYEMIGVAIELLNRWYSDWMSGRYQAGMRFSNDDLPLMLEIVENIGGVFGWFPSMYPEISFNGKLRVASD